MVALEGGAADQQATSLGDVKDKGTLRQAILHKGGILFEVWQLSQNGLQPRNVRKAWWLVDEKARHLARVSDKRQGRYRGWWRDEAERTPERQP